MMVSTGLLALHFESQMTDMRSFVMPTLLMTGTFGYAKTRSASFGSPSPAMPCEYAVTTSLREPP